ncbi:hypothetical protein Tco_0260137 [Tanacetum coccineum]
MELKNGACFWPATREVEEDDEAEEGAEGEAGNEWVGGSADIYRNLSQDRANDPTLWEVLKLKFEKSSTANTSCRDDDIYDAPPEGEKRVKRHKASKSSKSTRGSSSKQSAKDSTTYVSKQQ